LVAAEIEKVFADRCCSLTIWLSLLKRTWVNWFYVSVPGQWWRLSW